jgi:hypothetical protein
MVHKNVINFIELMDPYEFVKYQAERNATDANANYFTNGKTLDSYRTAAGVDWNKEISRTGNIFKTTSRFAAEVKLPNMLFRVLVLNKQGYC